MPAGTREFIEPLYEYFRPQDRFKHRYSQEKLTIIQMCDKTFTFMSHLVLSNSAENWLFGLARPSNGWVGVDYGTVFENFESMVQYLTMVQYLKILSNSRFSFPSLPCL